MTGTNPGGASLKNNTMWMMVGNTWYALCQWAILIIIARLGGADDVGVFTLALAIANPVVLFFELGMRFQLGTDAGQERDYTAYFGARAAASLAGLLSCFAAALWLGSPSGWTIAVIALSKTLESFSQMYYGYALQKERLHRVAKSLIMRGTASTVLLGIAFYMTGNLTVAAAAYTASWLFALLIYDRHNAPEKLHRIDREAMKNIQAVIVTGLPLGATAILGVLGLYMPRYFLERLHGVADLGVFSSMVYFITVGQVAVYALGQSMTPVLARYNANGEKRKFRRMVLAALGGVALLGVCGIAAAAFIGKFVLNLIYGPEFAAHAAILPVVALAGAVTYMGNILTNAVSAKRIFGPQAPAQLIVVIVTFFAAWGGIPAYGISGAAWVLVFGAVMTFIILAGILIFYKGLPGKNPDHPMESGE